MESSNVDVVDKIVVSGYDVKVSADNSYSLLLRSHTWLHYTKNCWTYIVLIVFFQGHVLSDGEPIQDVGFLLFSKSVDQKV